MRNSVACIRAMVFLTGQSFVSKQAGSLFPVRIPPGLHPTLEVPVHMLRLTELIQTLLTQLSAHTAHFIASKWSRIIIRQWIVDSERPGLHFFEDIFCVVGFVSFQFG